MWRLKSNVSIFLRISVSLSLLCCIYGMMCEIRHPQTAVCQATYVVKAKIIKVNWKEKQTKKVANKNNSVEEISEPANPFQSNILQAKLIRLYKGYRAVNASKGDLIYIKYPPYHLPIKEGQVYLLTGWSMGTNLQISICDWFSRWEDLTISQKFGIKRYYYWMFCACRIRTCYGENCVFAKTNERECLISPDTEECNTRKNICMVNRGRCDWNSPKGKTVCNQKTNSFVP